MAEIIHDIDQQTPPRRQALSKVSHVRQELGSLYRRARRGEIPAKDLSRYVYCLKTLGDLIIQENLEARLEALEKTIEENGQWAGNQHLRVLRNSKRN